MYEYVIFVVTLSTDSWYYFMEAFLCWSKHAKWTKRII